MLIAIKGEIDSNTITVRYLNTTYILTGEPMHRSSRRKINKETQTFNYTLYQIDLVGIYRTFHPKKEKKKQKIEYTFFKCTQNILQDR